MGREANTIVRPVLLHSCVGKDLKGQRRPGVSGVSAGTQFLECAARVASSYIDAFPRCRR
jgi:hypothetical protein